MRMDVILQTVSQLAAHRLAVYAASPHLQAFPSGRFCNGAQMLGVETSDYKGPCLVLLQNCQLTPKEFVEHVMGCFLRGYIVRIYWCNHLVMHKSSLVCQLKNLVKSDSALSSKATFRLQTYPRSLSEWLIDELPELDYAMHSFSHSLYAVESDGVIRYGIGEGQDMYLTACDREALFKGYVARACSKLEEALHVKGVGLTQDMVVLDVGAAPGAWTELLSKSVRHVVAVDPGRLNTNILGARVTHICRKVQDAMQDLLAYTLDKKFDLLVCDINKHPVEAAQIVLPLLEFVKGGVLLS